MPLVKENKHTKQGFEMHLKPQTFHGILPANK